MKYYFSYDVSGRLVSMEMCGGNGWSESCDLDCDDPHDHLAKEVRTLRLRENPDVIGFASWDCGYQSIRDYGDEINPACTFMHSHIYSAKAKVFLPKPKISLLINGEIRADFEHGSLSNLPTFDFTPLSKLSVQFVGHVPSNTMITLDNTMASIVAFKEGKIDLNFIDGFTKEIKIITPLHGMSSIFGVTGLLVSTGKFAVRGWQD